MKYPIYDVDGNILHMTDFDGSEKDSFWYQKRMSIKWAVKNGKSLKRANLERFYLSGLDLRGMNFKGANIKHAFFTGCDLRGAIFSHDVPVIEKIYQTVYDNKIKGGLLSMKSSRGRSGRVVALAGEKGRKLADEIGTATAAALIYIASDPGLNKIPRFNECVLTDMKRLAEREKK